MQTAVPEQATHKTVLVIEDDEDMLSILASSIADAGFLVMKAQNGEQGLALALQHHPDLILLDLLLPKVPGLDVLDSIRADPQTKQTPVIILSNLTENDAVYRSVALGTSAYFLKSDTPLAQIVAEVKSKLAG